MGRRFAIVSLTQNGMDCKLLVEVYIHSLCLRIIIYVFQTNVPTIENHCEALPRPSLFGQYVPKTCATGKSPVSTKCSYQCPSGFKLLGPAQKMCRGKHTGTWTSQYKTSSCIGSFEIILCCYRYLYFHFLLQISNHLHWFVQQITQSH